MIAFLTVLAVLLFCALVISVCAYGGQRDRVTALEDLVRAKCAELDALSIAGPTAYAALAPDAEPPVPAGWLADLHDLPTTHEREYPR